MTQYGFRVKPGMTELALKAELALMAGVALKTGLL